VYHHPFNSQSRSIPFGGNCTYSHPPHASNPSTIPDGPNCRIPPVPLITTCISGPSSCFKLAETAYSSSPAAAGDAALTPLQPSMREKRHGFGSASLNNDNSSYLSRYQIRNEDLKFRGEWERGDDVGRTDDGLIRRRDVGGAKALEIRGCATGVRRRR
jgi:hypothetical protein